MRLKNILRSVRFLAVGVALAAACVSSASAEEAGVVFEGKEGPGKGKHIVFVSGDEEYRSEDSLTQLARILAQHHGFKCTVLYAVDPNTGKIDPMNQKNIPGLEALKTADLMFIFTRFRNLPDEQMQYIDEYISAGKPVVGIRTATHAFANSGKYGKYNWQSKTEGYEQGFGRQVLGETWISHHGHHGHEGTRGVVAPGEESNPIMRGIKEGEIFGTTDVYGVRLPLPGDSKPIVLGQVTKSFDPKSDAVEGKKNDPMMPIAWTKTYEGADGKKGRAFASTIGAGSDMPFEGTRRLLVNGAFWALGMEDKIPEKSNVEIVGDFKALPFGNNGHKKDVKPADLKYEVK